jgi:adenylate kinase
MAAILLRIARRLPKITWSVGVPHEHLPSGPVMRLILLGPPGSGKGTQAQLLCKRLRLEHISTGDMLRDAKCRDTPLGRRAKPYMDSGRLVPDDLVNDIVADRFKGDNRPEHFVMDGYPRTLAQAVSFDQVLRQQYLDLTAVVQLSVDDAEIVRRLGGRWSCPTCKASYHEQSNPPRAPGVCDNDGKALVQRDDDKPETVRERLRVYHAETEELIPHYAARGLLREAPGEGGIEQTYSAIMQVLNIQAGPPC